MTTRDAHQQVRAADADQPRQRRVQSLALFGEHREIVIVHRGAEYRLRITRGDKLILTK